MAKQEKIDDWLDGGDVESDAESTGFRMTARGVVLNKSRLSELLGLAAVTIDRAVADGAPILGKGSRKSGWRINSADFFDWWWRRKVIDATGDPETASFDAARRREKTAQAKLRELEYERRAGRTVTIDQVCQVYDEELGVLRGRLLAIPTSVSQAVLAAKSAADVEHILREEIADALADITGAQRETWSDEHQSEDDED